MVENVAWDGYNRATSQRVGSEAFKDSFRAGLRSFVRKPPDDELGYAPPGIPGAGVFSPLIRTKGLG
ncbi:hypothetical protein Taro_033874 [Colocasia esculenta]|uniref:Uncharacterized protein n=1 Tax=Colocasia esculenta TaxID=4460 RepID=A0A843VZ53_COLES|nr:hypothetical protein [Colocasia esculenta]